MEEMDRLLVKGLILLLVFFALESFVIPIPETPEKPLVRALKILECDTRAVLASSSVAQIRYCNDLHAQMK